MADITVTTAAHANADDQWSNVAGPFWDTNLHGIVVFLDSSADIAYVETSDGGTTWGAKVTLVAGTIDNMTTFYDGQNPALSTFLLHIGYTDSVANRFRYININVSTLVVSSAVDIGTPTFTDPVYPSFITRTRNGNLIAAHHVLGGTQIAKKSSDTGANWSNITSPWSGESATDHDTCFPFYANTGDDADGAIIYGDLSASEISIKVYDDSANTWTETSIATSITLVVAATNAMAQVGWSANTATRVLLSVWTTTDDVGADLKCYEIQPTSVAAPTITARTDVVTNNAESGGTSMRVDRTTSTFYCFYLQGGTWGASVQGYYKTSADYGVTWSSATQISTIAGSWDLVGPGDYASGIQARIQWVWGNAGASLFTQTAINGTPLTPVVVLSGTLVPSATEDAVAAGGPTLIATITNGLSWASTIDDDATTSEDFIAAIVSATSETLGWNNIVIGKFYKREVLADAPLSYFRGTYNAWTDLGSLATNGTPTALTQGGALLLSSAQRSSVFNAGTAKVALGSTTYGTAGVRPK